MGAKCIGLVGGRELKAEERDTHRRFSWWVSLFALLKVRVSGEFYKGRSA